MFTSGSLLEDGGGQFLIKVEADLLPVENDLSIVESSDIMAAIMKVENEIVIEGEDDETNHTGASLKSYHAVSKQKKLSSMPACNTNSVNSVEAVHIKQESDLMPRQNGGFKLNSSAMSKVKKEFTSEDQTNRSGENVFFPEVTNCPMKNANIENTTSRMENSMILQEEEEIKQEEPKTLVDGYSVMPFDDAQNFSGFSDELFETVKIFEETHVNFENELFPQFYVSPFIEESEVTNHSSGSGTESPSTWQQSTTHNDYGNIELVGVSFGCEDLCPKNSMETPNGFAQKHTGLELCKGNSSAGGDGLQSGIGKQRDGNLVVSSSVDKPLNAASEEKWVLCTLCPAGFKFMHSLTKHLAGIHNVHVCIECFRKFRLRSELERHMKVHPTVNQYLCVFCFLKCKTEAELQSHVQIHSKHNKQFSCSQCFVGFDQSIHLLDHVLGCTNKKYSGQCEQQNETETKNESKNSRHLKESLKNSFVDSSWLLCSHCPARFKFKHSQKNHLAEEHNEFSCIECYEQFKLWSDLQTHLKVHPTKKLYSCEVCSLNCKTEAGLRVHMRSHPSSKAFSCAQCFIKFDESSHLTDHLSVHVNERLVSSLQCPSKLKINAELEHLTDPIKELIPTNFKHTSHLTIPYSEQEFACMFCSAKFKRKSVLKRHLLTHSEEKLFACTYCRTLFKTKDSLKRHLKRHLPTYNDEKLFACKHCPTLFKTKDSLRRHSKRHLTLAEGKPLSCTRCSALFKTKEALKGHLEIHAERPFSCDQCTENFESKCLLRRHSAAHERLGHFNEKRFVKFKSKHHMK